MIGTKYAIVGSGPAAFYAARAIRKRDPAGKLVMIGAEGYLPYFRPLISYYLAGLVPWEQLFLQEADYYRQRNIEFISGVVTEVSGRENVLTYQPLTRGEGEKREEIPGGAPAAGDARQLQFEKLLIASGGIPSKPDIPGVESPGVYVLRTLRDAEKIAARAKISEKALLIGGGLVSLKAAFALHKLGLATTLVIVSRWVLSQMLDEKGAAIVSAYLAEKGLKLILQNDVLEIHGNSAGVSGVTLADGQELEADLIVIGKGVKPCTPFLHGNGSGSGNASGNNNASGIKEEKGGVIVDAQLQTNLPGIYAAGDVAICRDLLLSVPANNPLWPNATAQGEIAGANMTGTQQSYRGSMRMNATDFFGLPVIAAGLGRVPGAAEQSLEIYEWQSPLRTKREPHYLRLVFQKENLVGYVAIGVNRKAGMLTNLIMSQFPLAPQQKERLINGDLVFPFSV